MGNKEEVESSSAKLESEAEIVWQSGLNWRSYISLLYAFLVFTPAVMYLQLVAVGVELTSAVGFCNLLIFTELTRLSGKPLNKHEAFIIMQLAWMPAGVSWIFLIYRMYYVTSPIPAQLGVTPHIPTWWAPSAETRIWELRTLFHPAWIPVILVYLASFILGLYALALALGILNRELYVERERLEFPMTQIVTNAVLTLTEREKRSLAIMSGMSVIAFIYGIILYAVPAVSTATGYPLSIIPIPWIDFTTGYISVQNLLPGGCLGMATDALLIGVGLVLPFKIVLSMFLGTIAVFMIGNPILINLGISAWANPNIGWSPGMDMRLIWEKGTLYFWAPPIIGMGLGAGIAPLILRRKEIIEAIKSLFIQKETKGTRYSGEAFSGRLVLFLFLVGALGLVALDAYLVPGFPIVLLLIYNTAIPFILSLVVVRMLGVTGQTFSAPYLRELTIVLSGYSGYEAWFMPFSLWVGEGWVASFKMAQLTNTTSRSWIYACLLGWPVALVLSYFFAQAFWSLAPIPSSLYPAPAITWPIQAIYQSIWITRPPGIFSPELIAYFFAGTFALSYIFEFFNLPISIISAVIGASTPPAPFLTMLVGAILGKILTQIKGEEWFNRNRHTFGAGITMGEGLAIVIGAALALTIRARWVSAW